MKKCPECGENLADDAVHCGKCGSKVETSDDQGEKKTMFGMGTVSQEDLEQAADGAEAASAEADDEDDGDDGFRLPNPGDTGVGQEPDGGAGQEGGVSGGETDSGTRLGLKGPAADTEEDDAGAALADTKAMPSIDTSEDEQSTKQEEAPELDGGRISSPGGDEGGGVSASADVEVGGDRPGGESPFAGDGGGRPSGVDRNTHESGRPVPEGPGDPDSMADTTPDGGRRGPEAETAPTDTRPVDPSEDGPAGRDTAADAGPSPADVDSGGGAPGAAGGGAGTEDDNQPVSGTATTTGSRASQPSVSGPSDAPPGAGPSAGPPDGDDQRATSPDGQTAPVEQSRNALAGDDRFGGGGSSQAQQMARGQGHQSQKPETQPGGEAVDDSGIDKKTLLIVVGVLFASGILCAGAAGLIYLFMT